MSTQQHLSHLAQALGFGDWLIVIGALAGIVFCIGTILYLVKEEVEYRNFMKQNNGIDEGDSN